MASINQLISEIANSVQQADSVPVRRAIRLSIIQARNKLIRQSYENNRFIDKNLQQRFKISLIDCPDGDLENSSNLELPIIKRSSNRVPRPTRLTNNLPFHSIRTAGSSNPVEVAYVKEASTKYYKYLPGMSCCVTYDYINGYIYIFVENNSNFKNIENIIIESVFENPIEIPEEHIEGITNYSDDDEFILSEDMIPDIKKLVLETFNIQVVRQTNEIPNQNIVK